jgi:hypothetical protein
VKKLCVYTSHDSNFHKLLDTKQKKYTKEQTVIISGDNRLLNLFGGARDCSQELVMLGMPSIELCLQPSIHYLY